MNNGTEAEMPDAVETDPGALNSSEDLDEDRLQVDPLEEGMDPPERWSAVDRFGTTPYEQLHGESFDERLREEEPDVDVPEMPDRPVAATPAVQLDDSIDDAPRDVEPVAPEERLDGPHSSAADQGQNADVAGGSVAEAIRTPPGE